MSNSSTIEDLRKCLVCNLQESRKYDHYGCKGVCSSCRNFFRRSGLSISHFIKSLFPTRLKLISLAHGAGLGTGYIQPVMFLNVAREHISAKRTGTYLYIQTWPNCGPPIFKLFLRPLHLFLIWQPIVMIEIVLKLSEICPHFHKRLNLDK